MRHTITVDALRRCLRYSAQHGTGQHGPLYGEHASSERLRAEKLIDSIAIPQLVPLLDQLTPAEARALFILLFDSARVTRTLEAMPRPALTSLLARMEDRTLAASLAGLSGPSLARVMALLAPERRTSIRKRMQAEGDAFAARVRPVASVLEPVGAAFPAHARVEDVLSAVVSGPLGACIWVLGEGGEPIGFTSHAQLLATPKGTPLNAMMTLEPRTVSSTAPLHVALAALAGTPGQLELAVVDGQGRLLGVVGSARLRAVLCEDEAAPTAVAVGPSWRRLIGWFAGSSAGIASLYLTFF